VEVCYRRSGGIFCGASGRDRLFEWKFETAGERRDAGRHLHDLLRAAETMPDPWDYFLSSPAVWNGAVYFGSGDGNVYALDAVSGSLKWKFKTGDDAEIHNHVGIQSSPAVADGTVYFGCRGSNVYAVDAKTGKQKWLYSTKGSWVNNSAAVYDGKVFFGTSIPGLLHAVDAKTAAEVFSLDTKFPVFASIAIADGMLYFGTLDGKFACGGSEDAKACLGLSERHVQAKAARNPESRWDLELRGNHVPKLL
jgi:eukaryotic-like serine/threonine-protein kinase